MKLYTTIEDNEKLIKGIFKNNQQVMYRVFRSLNDRYSYLAVFSCNMINENLITENVIRPLMRFGDTKVSGESIDYIEQNVITSCCVKRSDSLEMLIESVIEGYTVIIIDGVNEYLSIAASKLNNRSIGEPDSERVVKGPRVGFIESIHENINMVRRILKTPSLKLEYLELGRLTRTIVCISYIEGVVNQKNLEEVKNRLNKIDIDGILESDYIRELINDEPLSPFKTIGHTERPDVVCAKLMEGRVAIFCDGTPFVLTIPYLFNENFFVNEDYYNKYIYGSINRMIRIIGFIITISVPAIYVALITYHQEMIPTPLLLSISGSRSGVPFPTIVEALMMLFVFEILREAGVRLPTPIGQAISIVGALVLGQAAVDARIISAPIIIVTALTGITSFLIPKMIGALIVTRLALLILSSILGLYGYVFGIIALFIYLSSIRSFGIVYLAGTIPLYGEKINDTLIRSPWKNMRYRPQYLTSNLIRQKSTIKKDEEND